MSQNQNIIKKIVQMPIYTTNPDYAFLPGVVVIVDPDDVEKWGIGVEENAISDEDAWDASADEIWYENGYDESLLEENKDD